MFNSKKVDLALCGGNEILCIKIVAANSRFRLVIVYNPPCIASTDVSRNFEKLLDANNLRKPTVIIGDFNIDWSGNSQNKENLETLMRLHQYEQLVKEYTTDVDVDVSKTPKPQLIKFLQTP